MQRVPIAPGHPRVIVFFFFCSCLLSTFAFPIISPVTSLYLSESRCKFMYGFANRSDYTLTLESRESLTPVSFMAHLSLTPTRSVFSVIYIYANRLDNGKLQMTFDIRLWMASKAAG